MSVCVCVEGTCELLFACVCVHMHTCVTMYVCMEGTCVCLPQSVYLSQPSTFPSHSFSPLLSHSFPPPISFSFSSPITTFIYISSFAHVCELRYQKLILGHFFLSLLPVERWQSVQCWTQGTDKPTLLASPRLVSCGSASLSSCSVGAGSTAVGKARGLFSLAPLELDTGIHPSLVSEIPSLESVCCGKPMPAS